MYDPNDYTNPSHYRRHNIQAIEITRLMSFCAGNVVKYIWRAGDKDDIVKDLKKARWYLEDCIHFDDVDFSAVQRYPQTLELYKKILLDELQEDAERAMGMLNEVIRLAEQGDLYENLRQGP